MIGEYDKAWATADEVANRADKLACRALRKALPKGRIVCWKHGSNWRSGYVQMVSEYGQRSNASVQVESVNSGKVFWVSAWSILQWLSGEKSDATD